MGKTIQVVAFLAGLHASGLCSAPTLLVCPASVMAQWQRELQRWYSHFNVFLMHESGKNRCSHSEIVRRVRQSQSAAPLAAPHSSSSSSSSTASSSSSAAAAASLTSNRSNGILITTYESLRVHQSLLLPHEWGYAILDEGHKIRNPDAAVTQVCKQLRTPHRLIISGEPVQNNLKELWSLFDFIYPGKLGTLPVFEAEFCIPITQGGYANASPFQVNQGYKQHFPFFSDFLLIVAALSLLRFFCILSIHRFFFLLLLLFLLLIFPLSSPSPSFAASCFVSVSSITRFEQPMNVPPLCALLSRLLSFVG